MSDWISYEARLTEGYRRSAKLTWRYGTTYFWGAALLPKPQRKHVHAIYALCRLADDIVDLPNGRQPSHPEPSQMRPEPVEGHQSGASTSAVLSSSKGSDHISDDAIPAEPDSTLPDPSGWISDRLSAFADVLPKQLGRRRQYRSGDGSGGSHCDHLPHRSRVLRSLLWCYGDGSDHKLV